MKLIIGMACFILMGSCTNQQMANPKPRAFPKIEFLEKEYTEFSSTDCDFTFSIPTYSQVKKELYFFEEKTTHPCWFDLEFPAYNGSLHCSYYPVKNRQNLDKLIEDSFTLVGKHRQKANFRDELPIQKSNNVSGILFKLDGPIASPLQFFLTDSTSHFFRASLYFNNKVAPDSMAIVHQFIEQDILKLIESFEWIP